MMWRANTSGTLSISLFRRDVLKERDHLLLYFVYELYDPRDNKTFYVGVTNNPNSRYRQHIGQYRVHNEDLEQRVKGMRAKGIIPQIRICEVVYDGKSVALKREQYWIKFHIQAGANLSNIREVSGKIRDHYPRPQLGVSKKFDRAWEEYLHDVSGGDNVVTADRLETFAFLWLEILFPSKKKFIPLWKQRKMSEYHMC